MQIDHDPNTRRETKTLNLHESEWSKAGKKQPIFGPGAYWFFNVTLPTLVFAVVFGTVLSWLANRYLY